MRIQTLAAIISQSILALPLHAALIGYFASDYRDINPTTGQSASVAASGVGPIDSVLTIDQTTGNIYRRSGSNVITTDLTTGVSTTVILPSAPLLLGVFNQRLIGHFGADYREISPTTGQTTSIAPTGGGVDASTLFALDQTSGIAYLWNGQLLTSTNLTTGQMTTVNIAAAIIALGTFDQKLIGYFGGDYREINPMTGQTTFVSLTAGNAVNTMLTIDHNTGIAYRTSGPNLVSTNLSTGLSTLVALETFPLAIGATAVPEPTGAGLLASVCLFLASQRSRQRSETGRNASPTA